MSHLLVPCACCYISLQWLWLVKNANITRMLICNLFRELKIELEFLSKQMLS